MWNWKHLESEGWWSHTVRSVKLAWLLLWAAGAMVVHILVPFWEQPKTLQAASVAHKICEEIDKRE